MKEIETWRDLLDYLQTLTHEQLNQKAQFIVPSDINPFAEDGSVACDLLTGEKIYPRDHVLWDGRKFNELTSGDQI